MGGQSTEKNNLSNYREELAVFDGLIMKGEKIAIPRSVRSNLFMKGI